MHACLMSDTVKVYQIKHSANVVTFDCYAADNSQHIASPIINILPEGACGTVDEPTLTVTSTLSPHLCQGSLCCMGHGCGCV